MRVARRLVMAHSRQRRVTHPAGRHVLRRQSQRREGRRVDAVEADEGIHQAAHLIAHPLARPQGLPVSQVQASPQAQQNQVGGEQNVAGQDAQQPAADGGQHDERRWPPQDRQGGLHSRRQIQAFRPAPVRTVSTERGADASPTANRHTQNGYTPTLQAHHCAVAPVGGGEAQAQRGQRGQ